LVFFKDIDKNGIYEAIVYCQLLWVSDIVKIMLLI